MKRNKILFVLAIVMIITANSVFAAEGGIQFFEGTFKEALSKSKRTNKLIFIDFYADWCGPCKWMAKDVFTNGKVGEYFNNNFINMQINAEYDELELVEFIELEAYPTLVFFNSAGEIVKKKVGALDADKLLSEATNILEGPEIKARYDKDPYKYENVSAYIKTVSSEWEAQEIAIYYLSHLPHSEWTTENSWDLISNYVYGYDTEVVRYIVKNADDFYGQVDYDSYILDKIIPSTLKQAIEDENESKLAELIELEVNTRKLAGMMDFDERYYELETKYVYHFNLGNYTQFSEFYDELIRGYFWDNADVLAQKITEYSEAFVGYPEYMEVAKAWCERILDLQDSWETRIANSYAYMAMSDYGTSIEHARKAREMTDDEELKAEIDGFIEALEASR